MKPKLEADLARFAKLLEAGRDMHKKIGAVLDEMDAALAGRAGIGEHMKTCMGAFDRAWCVRYLPGQELGYVWNGQRDAPQMKRLILALGPDEVQQRIARFIKNDDKFYLQVRHNFGAFVASVNSHAGEAQTGGGTFDLSPPVADCAHVPRCGSDHEHTKKRQREMRAAGV